MSYMNWIYGMIMDNSYPQFKQEYEKAVKSNTKEFVWEGKPMRATFAKYVCILVDKHLLKEYEEHLEQYAIEKENDYISY